MPDRVKITIIGAGVVGCAIAWRLSKKFEDIVIVEKNPRIPGENQSSRNSGVVHAGIYYPQEQSPLKARVCVHGNRLLYEFCEEHGVPCRKTGKLIVATNEKDLDYLDDTMRIARENGVPGLRFISGDEAKAMEPNVVCVRAGYFPTSGIVEATQFLHKLYSLATQQGALFLPGRNVVHLEAEHGYFDIVAQASGNTEPFESEIVINCAGVYSDEIARMINPDSPYEVLPIRGEAAKFYKTRRPEIDHAGLNVYPVPQIIWPDGLKADLSFIEFQRLYKEKKVLKTVGVHLTPTFDLIDGNYEIGKTVTVGPATKGGISKEDLSSGSYPLEHFHREVHSFFPGLRLEDLEYHQAGIQAKLKGHVDYIIEPDPKHPRFIQLIGID